MAFNNIKLNDDGTWTKITDDVDGTFSLTSSGQHVVYNGAPPSDLIGHRYVSDVVDYDISGSEAIYARSGSPCVAVGNVINGSFTNAFTSEFTSEFE